MPYKVLIVDDEKLMRNLLQDHFQSEDYGVLCAKNANEAIELLEKEPDIIILDVNMPGMDGIELCKIIRNHVTCPIIFLTARVSEQDKINGLMIGGDDYITKPFSLRELSARMKAHLRREERPRVKSDVHFSHGLVINYSERTVCLNDKEIVFSKTEFDILELLSMNPKQVFDKERIYVKIWGLEADGDNTVVKEHIRKIRSKFLSESCINFIETVWGVGYKWIS